MTQPNAERIPVVHVSREAIEVDGARYALKEGDDVQLRERSDWTGIFVGILAAHGVLLVGLVFLWVDAPAIAWAAQFAVGGFILATSWLGAEKRTRFYEIVLARRGQKQIVAHSHAPEPVYRAFDELRQLGVVV